MERLKEFLRLNLIDGFIIMHRRFDEEMHEYLSELGIPHVYLLHCSRNSFEAVDMIDTDNYAGGYLGTKHLIDQGHRNIITLTCPWREFEDRTNGYLSFDRVIATSYLFLSSVLQTFDRTYPLFDL